MRSKRELCTRGNEKPHNGLAARSAAKRQSVGLTKEGPVVVARCAFAVVVLSLIPASVLAQGASTATIAGVVRDSSGAVLPGVTVEAASPALIEKVRTSVTDESGQYRLAELRPGVYTVTFSLAGFSTLRRDGLELRSSFTAQVDAELAVSTLQETITVTGATPLVDVSSATQQRTVTREVLDTVPTAKSVLGMAALIPAVVEPPNASASPSMVARPTTRACCRTACATTR
jgi:hypothetical protein